MQPYDSRRCTFQRPIAFPALIIAAIALLGPGLAFAQDPHQRAAPEAPRADEADDAVTSLPLVRAVMFSSGVGYFEHAGTVTDDANVRLVFQREQINDVLKSLIVMDAGGGTVTRASYASRDPLERTLGSFAVDLSDEPTLPELLKQLRGTRVTVHAPEPVTGRILSVEKRRRVTDDTTIEEHLLTLAAEDGMRSLVLEQVDRVQLDDPDLQSELSRALTTLDDARDIERRPVDLRFEGEGERDVRVGYLIETPVWKTSYRLDLTGTAHANPSAADDDDDDNEATLQGWAITENMTETDWQDVQLSLVSGQPISFIQDLYTPLYFDRPEVKLPSHAQLTPRLYHEGLPADGRVERLEAEDAAEPQLGRADRRRQAEALMQRSMAGQAAPQEQDRAQLDDTVQARAAAGEVGELFRYTLDHPVTLPRQRSAMLPIVADRVEAEKLSIYNQREDDEHPRSGVALTNSTGLNLLAGPVTVLDGGMYAGDALLDSLGPDDTRLLSYAVDLSMTVDDTTRSSQHITAARLVRGVLHLTRRQEYARTYRVRNKADEPRTLMIEHPVTHNRELIEPAEPYERTSQWYRFRVPMEAETTGEFTVREQRTRSETIAILDRPVRQFIAYTRNDAIPAGVREALETAAEMKHELNELEERLAERQAELKEITEGQERLRRNIESVGRDSQLGQRYLSTLSEEEDRIEALQEQIAELRERIEQRREALADYLQGLNVR